MFLFCPFVLLPLFQLGRLPWSLILVTTVPSTESNGKFNIFDRLKNRMYGEKGAKMGFFFIFIYLLFFLLLVESLAQEYKGKKTYNEMYI